MEPTERLRPFVSSFVVDWLRQTPDARHRTATGTLVFVDISGFTRLTERLASRGKIGAEEMSGLLDHTFAALLAVAYDQGGWLVKWGGDAVLLLFEGANHADHACTAAFDMRQTMRTAGRLRTSVGQINLRISIGMHTDSFDFFLAGSRHHELIITGPAATTTVDMEQIAEAGDIILSAATAACLDPRVVGAPKGRGFLLRRSPRSESDPNPRALDITGVDLGSCLPAATRRHLLTGVTDPEHRLVTAAFVEFSGIGTLLTDEGVARASDAVDHVVGTCQEAAERHGVTFWETDIGADGGKVMLVSGAPGSAGQDEDRMLATLREIIDAAGALRLRAGVNCGRVYAGEFGPAFRRTYSVKGDAVNLAARLMGKAATGDILAAKAVLARARTGYATEHLAPLTVKGKTRPVYVQLVKQALGAATAVTRIDLPFAGREPELAQLLASLAAAGQGSGQVWDISGEPGIGKSRLVAEVVARAGSATVVTAVCDEYHSATPYATFRHALRQVVGVGDDASPATTGARLLDVVVNTAPELLPWTPLVAAVLDAQVPSTPESEALESTFRKAAQEEHTTRLLAALVPGTLLLTIEDVHLMDDASLDLLNVLASRATEQRWVIITTRAPDLGPALTSASEVHRLELQRLPADVVDALVKQATEERPLAPHELSALNRRAGGNPLFVQELLAATRGGQTVAGLPDSVEGVMAVQIDRLPPVERRALRIASVLGVRVERHVFEEMLRADGIDVSVAGMLGDFFDIEGDHGFTFRHALTRETAYEGLPFRRRQELHGLAGDVIERLAGARADDDAGLLSLHFLQARRFEGAWRYACIAGRRAEEVHAHVEAAEFFGRSLEAVKRLAPEVTAALRREITEVTESLGDAHYKLGAFAEAATAYRSALAAAPTALGKARACYKCSLAADRIGKFANALRWLTKARRLLETSVGEESGRLRAQCSAEYGLIRHWQGRDVAAIASLREAVRLAEQAGANDALATALVWLDNCEMTLGRSGTGEHAQRALEIWRSIEHHPWEEARTLNQLGIRSYFEGRWDRAVDYYEKSKHACERAGDQFTAAVESGNMAEVLSDQGHLAEAEPLLREAIRVWRAAAAPSFVAFGKSQLGRLSARAGRFDEAAALLESARNDYLRDGEQVEVLETDARIAECLLLKGSDAAALTAADAALARLSTMPGVLPQLPLLQRVRGLALARLGDFAGALNALDVGLHDARTRGARHEVAWTTHAILAVRNACGLPQDPALVLEQKSLVAELGLVAVAEPGLPTLEHGVPAARQRSPEPEGVSPSAGQTLILPAR